jgi:quercetin dioxygenase-like cupin family protein
MYLDLTGRALCASVAPIMEHRVPRTTEESDMAATMPETAQAITRAPGEGEHVWAFGTLATLKATGEQTAGRATVIEQRAPRGAGSPLHVHRREDEWFYVLEGSITFWVGGDVFEAEAGAFVYGPRDVPHTFAVSSDEARFLLVTGPSGFDAFMRAAGEPAPSATIPPPAGPPADMGPLVQLAAGYGIEILGPPGIPA